MDLIRKILIFSFLTVVSGLAIKKYYPEKWKKIEETASPFVENVESFSRDLGIGDSNKVLGEENDSVATGDSSPVSEIVKQVSEEVIKSEVVTKTVEKVNEIVTKTVEEKITEIKEIPEQQAEKITNEVKRQICEDWLKYQGDNSNE